MTNKDEIKLYFQITSEIINCKDKNKKARLRLQGWYPLALHEKEVQELKQCLKKKE
jgi:hypothetical protein